jgi:hypothetical protein
MGKKYKGILLISLITLAVALLAYGLFIHSMFVVLPEGADYPALIKSETLLIRDVTIGGVVKDETGGLRQTYTDITKAAAACPT